MTTKKDATGQPIIYTYDSFCRVIRQQDGTSTTQMAYDDAARTLTITGLGKQPDSGEL